VSVIVVGVDGSSESKAALRWALDEARLRGATLRVVRAWTTPLVYEGAFIPPDALDTDALQQEAAEALDELIGQASGAETPVSVERLVVQGAPARVLVEAAEQADLLVVGSRGHGGFAGLLLGSVSQQCAHHAPCPVVIIRPRRDAQTSAAETAGSATAGSE
jgi:nucleotide-binding universal stress UspA family protein